MSIDSISSSDEKKSLIGDNKYGGGKKTYGANESTQSILKQVETKDSIINRTHSSESVMKQSKLQDSRISANQMKRSVSFNSIDTSSTDTGGLNQAANKLLPIAKPPQKVTKRSSLFRFSFGS